MEKEKSKGKVISDLRKTEKITLPVTKAEVELWESFTFGDFRKVEKKKGDIDKTSFSIVLLVKDWDLMLENGKKLPVNEKSIDLLPMEDVNFLSMKIKDKAEEIAKKVKRS